MFNFSLVSYQLSEHFIGVHENILFSHFHQFQLEGCAVDLIHFVTRNRSLFPLPSKATQRLNLSMDFLYPEIGWVRIRIKKQVSRILKEACACCCSIFMPSSLLLRAGNTMWPCAGGVNNLTGEKKNTWTRKSDNPSPIRQSAQRASWIRKRICRTDYLRMSG